jgi:broad specificity phosphatase PhoE
LSCAARRSTLAAENRDRRLARALRTRHDLVSVRAHSDGERRVILVRHGQTRSNVAREGAPLSGWYDLELTDRGRQEAQALAGWFRRLASVRLVFASSSRRAMETARIMVEGTPASAGLFGRDDLREIYCGDLEGIPIETLQAQHPELWRENLSQARDDFRWPGGESYAELRARALAAVARIADQYGDEPLVLVTHAGVIAQLVGAARGTPARAWGAWRPQNASVTTLGWGRQAARVVAYDDVGHLRCLEEAPLGQSGTGDGRSRRARRCA